MSIYKTRPEFYETNIARAEAIEAVPGLLSSPDGSTEPAVILFNGRGFGYALNHTQALRIADAIATILQAQRTTTK